MMDDDDSCSDESDYTVNSDDEGVGYTWIDDTDEITLTFGQATKDIFEISQSEEVKVRSHLLQLLKKDSITHRDIVTLVFGESSPIAQLLTRKAGISYIQLANFLATAFVCSVYDLSYTHMDNKDEERMNFDHLLDADEYMEVWKAIACNNTRVEPLWPDVETALNKTLFDLFVSPLKPQIMMVLDDDKCHFRNKKGDLKNLKYCPFVRDNRKGFTAHTVVSVALGLPLQMVWERDHDSVLSTYERMIAQMFGRGTNQNANITGSIWCSDRFYWNPDTLEHIVGHGGDLLG
jgi:hypothetical protein